MKEHHATRLHYDLRLESEGVLKSWAVPKGPSLNPKVKRQAVMVADHKLAYLMAEGRIPAGLYGAGEVRIWDNGTYELVGSKNFANCLRQGRIDFQLFGNQINGQFSLCHTQGNMWLLAKLHDDYADVSWQLQTILPGVPGQESWPLHESLIGDLYGSNLLGKRTWRMPRRKRSKGDSEQRLRFDFDSDEL